MQLAPAANSALTSASFCKNNKTVFMPQGDMTMESLLF